MFILIVSKFIENLLKRDTLAISIASSMLKSWFHAKVSLALTQGSESKNESQFARPVAQLIERWTPGGERTGSSKPDMARPTQPTSPDRGCPHQPGHPRQEFHMSTAVSNPGSHHRESSALSTELQEGYFTGCSPSTCVLN